MMMKRLEPAVLVLCAVVLVVSITSSQFSLPAFSNLSISTDKATYLLNETVRIPVIAQENVTTNLTILNPMNDTYSTMKEKLGSFTHLYYPGLLGNYSVHAICSLRNESSDLSAFFSVMDAVEEVLEDVTNETLPGNVTNETVEIPENATYSPLESASLSTDKFMYYLNETVRISVKAPENTTTNLSITDPIQNLSSAPGNGSFNISYTPEFLGNYSVNAKLFLLNETRNLTTSFRVVLENITNETMGYQTASLLDMASITINKSVYYPNETVRIRIKAPENTSFTRP
jgi:hypothetical protein